MIELNFERYYSIGEVSEKLNLKSNNTTRNYCKSGALKSKKIGRNWIIKETDLIEFLNNK